MAITEAPPTDLPEWATSGTNVGTPAPARIVSGWASGEIVAKDHLNWILNLLAAWVAYLWGRVQTYTTLQGLYAGLTDGSTAYLGELDDEKRGQGVNVNIDYTTANAFVSGNGPFLVVATAAGEPRVIARYTETQGNPGAATLFTLTRGTAATNVAIVCRGDYCAVASGNRVDLFVISTGVKLWTYNHGAAVYDVDIHGDYVIYGGAASGGVRVRRLNLVAGTSATTYDPGADVAGIVALADGRCVIQAATPFSLFGGADSVQCLSTALGVDWAAGSANYCSTRPRCMATDGKGIFIGGDAGYVTRLHATAGAVGWTFQPNATGPDVIALSVDQGGVFGCFSDGAGDDRIARLDKATGANLWEVDATYVPTSIYVDGAACFVALASNYFLIARTRGNRPSVWQRVASAKAIYLPYPWLTQPVGEE